ncbi:helix-turn-helix domain-containing protein [Parapedobacter soli]|uniref:helix-turn-helix domain-containing protein n=1 Tax=Parapedobacter soli TaxID=416955 RepID=UPI0036F3D458
MDEKSPLQIIHDRILLEAKNLLHYTKLHISEIAYELGFESVQVFSWFFKWLSNRNTIYF